MQRGEHEIAACMGTWVAGVGGQTVPHSDTGALGLPCVVDSFPRLLRTEVLHADERCGLQGVLSYDLGSTCAKATLG